MEELLQKFSKLKNSERLDFLQNLNQSTTLKTQMALFFLALQEDDPFVREEACRLLGNLGEKAKEATFLLTQALQDKHKKVQTMAAWALGKIGPDAKKAVPALEKILHHSERQVQFFVVEALLRITGKEYFLKRKGFSSSLKVFGLLVIFLVFLVVLFTLRWKFKATQNDIPKKTMRTKTFLLTQKKQVAIEKPTINISHLFSDLRDERKEVRLKTLKKIAALEQKTPALLKELLHTLKDNDNEVRLQCSLLLSQVRKPGISILIEGLKEEQTQKELISILSKIGSPVVLELKTALKDKTLCFSAVEILGNIGPASLEVVPDIIQALQFKDRYLGKKIAWALAKIDLSIISILLNELEKAELSQIQEIVFVLEQIGEPAIPYVVPALLRPKSYPWAVKILRNIGPKSIPYLIKMLQDLEYRKDIIVALGDIGLTAKEAVPVLIQLLNGSDPDLSERCVASLSLIGVESFEELLPFYYKDFTHYWIASVFEKMGKKAAPAVPGLLRALENLSLQKRTVEILAQIGPQASEAIPALINVLKQDNSIFSRKIVWTLLQIGKEATPFLIWSLNDVALRKKVKSALIDLGKEALPTLIDALKYDTTCESVSEMILLLGEEAIPELINALLGTQIKYQRARKILLTMGAEVIPSLTPFLKNDDPMLRLQTALILKESCFHIESLVPHLIESLEDPLLRRWATELLFELVAKEKDELLYNVPNLQKDQLRKVVIGALIQSLKVKTLTPFVWDILTHKNMIFSLLLSLEERELVVQASQILGNLGEVAIPSLVQGLRKKSIRGPLFTIFTHIGEMAVPELVKVFPKKGLGVFALEAIRRIEPKGEKTVSALIKATKEERSCFWALEALEELGPKAKNAIPAVEALKKHSQFQIRLKAKEVLKAIQKKN